MIQCGIVSGVLGIGGGLLIGPLLLNLLHLRPEVQGATTNVLVFCGTISGVLYLFIMGTLQYDWAIVLFSLSLISAIISKFLFNNLAKELGPQVFVLALIIIIGLATMTTPVLTGIRLQTDQKNIGSKTLQFSDLCAV